jgi:alkylated DNA nucleotide flippase Atl1
MSCPVRIPALASLLFLTIAQAAGAVPLQATPRARGDVILVHPLSLTRIADMDFATLGVTTGGTATIDPVNGTMTVSGGLQHLAGTPSPARYVGAALKKTVVNIRIPKQPVLVRRAGGTETLTLSNFTLDGQDKKALAQQTSFSFAVGAQISVPAGTVDGVYVGDLDVTVQYP